MPARMGRPSGPAWRLPRRNRRPVGSAVNFERGRDDEPTQRVRSNAIMSYRSHPTFHQFAGFRARRETCIEETPWRFTFDAPRFNPEPCVNPTPAGAETFMRGLLDALGAYLQRAGSAA